MKIRLGDLKRIIREAVESTVAGPNDSNTAYKEFLALEKSLSGQGYASSAVRFFQIFGDSPEFLKTLQDIYDSSVKIKGKEKGKKDYYVFFGKLPKAQHHAQQVSAVFNLLEKGKTVQELYDEAMKYAEGRDRFQEKYERDPMYASSTKMIVDKMTGTVLSRDVVDQGRLGT